ncbi:hypothetical protein KUV57_11845 [Epibacterium sp. DP7N7-1]|nr:hypothetical protein [Epibacterium sp. DP7N7-1]
MTKTTFPLKLRTRPECQADGEALEGELIAAMEFARLTLLNPKAPEGQDILHSVGGMIWEFEATSPREVAVLIQAMDSVPDGHRMVQTLDEVNSFSGDAFQGEAERAKRILSFLGDSEERARQIYLTYCSPNSREDPSFC